MKSSVSRLSFTFIWVSLLLPLALASSATGHDEDPLVNYLQDLRANLSKNNGEKTPVRVFGIPDNGKQFIPLEF